MNSAIKPVAACLICCFALQPAIGSACAIVTREEAARRQQQRIEHSKAEAIALRDEADLVFTGKLSRLSLDRETVDQTEGRNTVRQTYGAVFEFVDNIKGEYVKGQQLTFTITKNLIYVGCGSRPFRSSLPKENGQGERYLVYARAGQILRTNHLPDDVQPLTGYEEAQLVRTAPE